MRPYQFDPKEVVVAVDIGTTKVCAVAGRLNEYGKIEILGMGKVRSEGVLRGVISNIEKTVNAIKEAIGYGGMQLAIAHFHENVGARGFGHVTAIVEHQGIDEAVGFGLMLGQGCDHVKAAGLGVYRCGVGGRATPF